MGKVIYLSRHGESVYNTQDRLGGNSEITSLGENYAKELYQFIKLNEDIDNLNIYTSELIRTKQTAKYFKNKTSLKFLNEINAGIFEDKTYGFVKENYILEHNSRNKDKFNYKYPNGESYKNLQDRVLHIFSYINKNLIENKNSLIICHNAVVRLIYGKLLNIPNDKIPYINIPLHTLFKFEKYEGGYKLNEIKLI